MQHLLENSRVRPLAKYYLKTNCQSGNFHLINKLDEILRIYEYSRIIMIREWQGGIQICALGHNPKIHKTTQEFWRFTKQQNEK